MLGHKLDVMDGCLRHELDVLDGCWMDARWMN